MSENAKTLKLLDYLYGAIWWAVIATIIVCFLNINTIINWAGNIICESIGKPYYSIIYQVIPYPIAYSSQEDKNALSDYPVGFFWKNLENVNLNSAIAANNLGIYFEKNSLLDETSCKAFSWYIKSAREGFPSGQYNLARMYLMGKCVPKNIMLGFAWLNVAKAAGLAEAAHVYEAVRIERSNKQKEFSEALSQKLSEAYVNKWLKDNVLPIEKISQFLDVDTGIAIVQLPNGKLRQIPKEKLDEAYEKGAILFSAP